MNWGKVLRELQGRAKAETGSAEGGTCNMHMCMCMCMCMCICMCMLHVHVHVHVHVHANVRVNPAPRLDHAHSPPLSLINIHYY